MNRLLYALTLLFIMTAVASADCIPFDKAQDKIGSNACVTGKVLKVGGSKSGTKFLDFCEDYKNCPFVVVVFARDLKDVGDVAQLEGKLIEISGKVVEYNGRAEIVLKDLKQLHGEAANLPPVPKTFDADKRGKFSAGSIGKSSSKKKSDSSRRSGQGMDTEID